MTEKEMLEFLKSCANPEPVVLGNKNKSGKCGMCGVSVPKLYPRKVGQVQFYICPRCKSIMDM